MPVHTSLVEDRLSTSNGTWDISGDTIVWTLELAVGEVVSLTYAATILPDTVDGLQITNTVVFTAAGFRHSRSAITTVDAQPPVSTITMPVPNEIVSGPTLTMAGTASD